MLLSHIHVSLSLPLSLPFSLSKINKHIFFKEKVEFLSKNCNLKRVLKNHAHPMREPAFGCQ